jgi:elongation factor P
MLTASELRPGIAIRFEDQIYKVIAADYHPGQGKMGGVTHARLRNLSTGTLWEHGFRSELKVEEVALEKRSADFLYADAEECTFMDPLTFDQYTVSVTSLGHQARLLSPEMRVNIELLDGRPISVQFPDTVDLRVTDTTPPMHNTQDSTWKTARLATGLEIQVPQFIKIGDVVRVDANVLRYMDRARTVSR